MATIDIDAKLQAEVAQMSDTDKAALLARLQRKNKRKASKKEKPAATKKQKAERIVSREKRRAFAYGGRLVCNLQTPVGIVDKCGACCADRHRECTGWTYEGDECNCRTMDCTEEPKRAVPEPALAKLAADAERTKVIERERAAFAAIDWRTQCVDNIKKARIAVEAAKPRLPQAVCAVVHSRLEAYASLGGFQPFEFCLQCGWHEVNCNCSMQADAQRVAVPLQ